jgi:hypothetical protein
LSPRKQSNFILGELASGGELSFVVENLPKTTPPTGCPGQWMFKQMMAHFGANVTAIQGNWLGAASDNLTTMNHLTAGGAMPVADAARQTWTGKRAREHGYTSVEIVCPPVGAPGAYTHVCVRFKR